MSAGRYESKSSEVKQGKSSSLKEEAWVHYRLGVRNLTDMQKQPISIKKAESELQYALGIAEVIEAKEIIEIVLGCYSEYGLNGVERNGPEAFAHYKKSAQLGAPEAYCRLVFLISTHDRKDGLNPMGRAQFTVEEEKDTATLIKKYSQSALMAFSLSSSATQNLPETLFYIARMIEVHRSFVPNGENIHQLYVGENSFEGDDSIRFNVVAWYYRKAIAADEMYFTPRVWFAEELCNKGLFEECLEHFLHAGIRSRYIKTDGVNSVYNASKEKLQRLYWSILEKAPGYYIGGEEGRSSINDHLKFKATFASSAINSDYDLLDPLVLKNPGQFYNYLIMLPKEAVIQITNNLNHEASLKFEKYRCQLSADVLSNLDRNKFPIDIANIVRSYLGGEVSNPAKITFENLNVAIQKACILPKYRALFFVKPLKWQTELLTIVPKILKEKKYAAPEEKLRILITDMHQFKLANIEDPVAVTNVNLLLEEHVSIDLHNKIFAKSGAASCEKPTPKGPGIS